MNRVWLQTFVRDHDDARRSLTVALSAVGIDLTNPDEHATGPGIVYFDQPSDEVMEAIRERSDGGIERVMAVAATPDCFRGPVPWQMLQVGASDAFAWEAEGRARDVAARLERWSAVDALVQSPIVQRHLVGTSRRWSGLLRQLVEIAAFSEGSVLLLGESGTGKELLARLIHTLDRRPRKGELVILDCTTVVPELSGSEFFGHERGAFTSAALARDGAFALADGGTLFLDEVGELPLALQAQLLRVVQERTYKRVGGNTWFHTGFRLVCATNRDLAGEVARGAFRHDFFHRIASRVCRLPPLRERRGDILPLARHFFQEARPGQPPPELDPAVEAFLLARDYPGNVRELKQLVARIADRHVGSGPVTAGEIPLDDLPAEPVCGGWPDPAFCQGIERALGLGVNLKEITRVAAETAIRLALEAEGNSLQRAARRLGVTDRALQMRRAQRVDEERRG